MIIEIYDIAEKKEYLAHAVPLPEGCTLGLLMSHDPKVAAIIPYIKQARVNGERVTHWEDYQPRGDDRIRFDMAPHEAASIATFLYWAYIVISVALAAYSIYSIVTAPGTPKQHGQGGESGIYTFEGLRNAIAPGGTISVTYGKHRLAGQLLMYYLSMLPDNSGLAMNMLLSLGEGPVDSIDEVELNQLPFTMLNSVSMETRLGHSSQSIIEGFETIKNTYYDGREISDERELVKSLTSCSQIIYRTAGFDVGAIEHFVIAPAGITNIGLSAGKHHGAWVDYTLEYRDAENAVCDNPAWSEPETYRINGKDPRVEWSNAVTNFPYSSRWDVRFTWVSADRHPARNPERMNQQVQVRISLHGITEIRGPSSTFSHEALLALRAAPTRQLHGGTPLASAVMRGRKVDNYSSVDSYENKWTQNPAWPILDYLTNSRYGMGAFVQTADVDLQSFIDFATLANTLADFCIQTNPGTRTHIGQCYGTPDFKHGDPIKGDGGFPDPPNDDYPFITDPYECFALNSKFDGVLQHGYCVVRMCCPPARSFYGVASGEYLCEDQQTWFTVRQVNTGSPVFGLIAYQTSDSVLASATMYGMVYHHGSSTIVITRWNNQQVNTYGTILATHSYALLANDFFSLNVHRLATTDNSTIVIDTYITRSLTTVFSARAFDTSAERITPAVAGLAGLTGVVVLPSDLAGDYHIALIENWGHACLACDDPGAPIPAGWQTDVSCRIMTPGAEKKEGLPWKEPLGLGSSGDFDCGDGIDCVTITVSGGVGPYTWATTRGVLTVTGDNSAEICADPNPGSAESGIAYGKVAKFIQVFCDCRIEWYGCADQLITSCTGVGAGPCWAEASGSSFGCSCTNPTNSADALFRTQGTPPPPLASSPCAGLEQYGILCDERTQDQIDNECNPCRLSLEGGAVVTVTDSLGNSAFIAVASP